MRDLLVDIADCSDKVAIDSTAPTRASPRSQSGSPARPRGSRFAGLPMGHEFTSLVLALLLHRQPSAKEEEDAGSGSEALGSSFGFVTYVSLTCRTARTWSGAEP